MTKAQNIKMLTGLGFPLDIATKMSADIPDAATATDEAEIESAMTACVTKQTELFTAGAVYKDAIKAATDKKIAEINSKFVKRIGELAALTPEDIKDKKTDEILDIAWQKAAKMGNKSIEEVQAELKKKDDELRNVREVEIPALEGRIEKERFEIRSDNGLMKKIGGLKLRDGIPAEDLVVLTKIKAAKEGYLIDFDDKGEILFTDKDKNKLKTKDQKDFMKTEDILTAFLDGHIKKSNAPDDDDDDDQNKKRHIIKPDDNKDDHRGEAVKFASSKAEAHAAKLAAGND